MSSPPYTLFIESPADVPESTKSRLSDVAAFSRGVVHDVRNPLNVIVANLYLLRDRLSEADPRTLRPVERITDQVRNLEAQLNDYLANEQADLPTRQRVHLNDVVRSVVESMTVSAGCQLEMQLEPDLPLIDADPSLLESLLRGLIRNALRATSREGHLRICTGEEPGRVVLVVQDNGPGIAEADLPRVFEPFFSTWEDHAGLGLPLAAKVARAHGGRAFIRTGPGVGTQVTIELPASPTTASA